MMQMDTQEKDSRFWTQLLPEINKTIAGTLASLEAREQVLDSISATSAGNFPSRLAEMRARLEGGGRQPEEMIVAADALLQEVEQAYRGKLAGIEALRQKLADWAGRAIR